MGDAETGQLGGEGPFFVISAKEGVVPRVII